MERKIAITKDGSHTVIVPEMDVMYHSLHGAIQESMHVFIEAGLNPVIELSSDQPIHIFEMGFGSGLNALVTLLEAEKTNRSIHYTAIELYPLEETQVLSLNYCDQLKRKDLQPVFEQLHHCEWEKDILITTLFTIHKTQKSLLDFSTNQLFKLIYFDAFAPAAQPELWIKEVFEKLYDMLLPGGILVTYCSKGEVRRNMIAASFKVEKLPGPPGKREMLRGKKIT